MFPVELAGSRAIVVGAGFRPDRAGIGYGAAFRLARAGARVACLDFHSGRAGSVVADIEKAGGSAFPVIVDVTDPDAATHAITEAATELGGLDICVDIVGSSLWDRLTDVTNQDWDWTLRTNLSQVFYVFRAAADQMVAQGTGGTLICVSSADGIQSAAFHVAYGAAKAGVISLVRSLADELGPNGIRVNAVAPGNVGFGNSDAPDVPFGSNPINPLMPPRGEHISDAILFLASTLSSRVTGQTLLIDGGALLKSRWGVTDAEFGDMNGVARTEPGVDL